MILPLANIAIVNVDITLLWLILSLLIAFQCTNPCNQRSMADEAPTNSFQSDLFDGLVSNSSLTSPPNGQSSAPLLSFDFVHEERLARTAIVVRDLLSQEECDKLIAFIDSHEKETEEVGSTDGEEDKRRIMTAASSSPTHRNNLRMCISSQSLSSTLLDRLRPVLTSIDQHNITCTAENSHTFLNKGFGMEGEWRVHSLNSCFRLCKYHSGGHFGPHYDSDFVVDAMKRRSLKTFMVYLNDDYEGGETNFVENHELNFDKERQIYCAPPETVFASLKARRGDCLVFDHLLLHEGQQVTAGQKYIIRSDLMYEKEEEEEVDGEEAAKRRRQREALELFQAGAKLEEGGDVTAAIQHYSRAFKICPEIEDAYA